MPSGPVYLAFGSPALDAKNVEGVIQAARPLEVPETPRETTISRDA